MIRLRWRQGTENLALRLVRMFEEKNKEFLYIFLGNNRAKIERSKAYFRIEASSSREKMIIIVKHSE